MGGRHSADEGELAPDQLIAFRQMLGSPDFITLFRGGAGAGKRWRFAQ